MTDSEWLHTWIGSSDRDRITVAGRDLATEIMGRFTLTELAYLLVTRREPTAAQTRILDAVLVSLADHGLTPSALATRLTYTGAPESVQGAIAAGLLGAGSVFLGPAGDTAQFLADALADLGTEPDDAALRDAADAGGARLSRSRTSACPDSAIPCTRSRTRAPRASTSSPSRPASSARSSGSCGSWPRCTRSSRAGTCPINGAGAGGATLVDCGIPPSSVRGFVLIARTAGLVGHLAEEVDDPIGMRLWLEVEDRARNTD